MSHMKMRFLSNVLLGEEEEGRVWCGVVIYMHACFFSFIFSFLFQDGNYVTTIMTKTYKTISIL